MDTSGNQRKRAGRLNKSNNDSSMGPPQPVRGEDNQVLEVTSLAKLPKSEQGGSLNRNAPVAECRRSSRKKIIKFDVRDLLNKNRKPHKIQIEARIDSNAPTTSKNSSAAVGETSATSSSSGLGDLSSKQKTFLEKSAIFRRYSISQEPKPPPPPLPLPPSLLGKGNDKKDLNVSDTTTTRRLSRTQEFFSNVMIKPKQTTSLIVAQMESSAPSQVGKRKNFNKSMEIGTKILESIDSPLVHATLQKKRGRPLKTKIHTSEEVNIKKISPDKATNWKEYKACLAQQSSADENTEKSSIKSSDALSADVVLEISSSSSHNSNTEESKDKQELDIIYLDQEKLHEKNQKNNATKLLPIAAIIEEGSKDNVLKRNQNEKLIQKDAKEETVIEKTDAKDIEITKDSIIESKIQNKVVEITSMLQVTNKDQLEVSLEKEINSNTKDIIKSSKNQKNSQEPSKETEKDPIVPQSSLNETTRNRRQIKLSESMQKQTDSKGIKTLTNLNTSLQPDTHLKSSPPNNESTAKIDIYVKTDNNSIDNQSSKESGIEIVSKENTKILTALDGSTQKKDSKNVHDSKVIGENTEQPKEDDTAEQNKINQMKIYENLQKDFKDGQSSKMMPITRRSRTKIDDSITKDTNSNASSTIKEQKSVKRNQIKLKDTLQQDTDTKTSSSTEEDDILQKDIDTDQSLGDELQKDSQSNKEVQLDSKTSKSIKEKHDTLQNDNSTKTSQANKEQKIGKTVQTTIEDSPQTITESESLQSDRAENDSATLQYTNEDESVTTTRSNKRKLTKKEANAQKEAKNDNLQKDTDSEDSLSNNNEIDSKTSQSTTDKESVATTRGNTRKFTKKETNSQKESKDTTKLDSSIQNENFTENIEVKAGVKVQTKLEDYSQENAESEASKTSQAAEEEPESKIKSNKKEAQTLKESKNDCLQKDIDSEASKSIKEDKRRRRTPSKLNDFIQHKNLSQTHKEIKTRKRGQTIKLTDSSQKDTDSNKEALKESEDYSLQKEIDLKVSQSTKEGVRNRRNQSKLTDSLQKDTDSEDSHSNKEEIYYKTKQSTVKDASNKRKLTKEELNAHKEIKDDKLLIDKNSEGDQSSKEELEDPVENETISKKSQSTNEEETTSTPGNKGKFNKKETPKQKNYKIKDFACNVSDDVKIANPQSDKDEKQTNIGAIDKKQTSRNTRTLNKLKNSIQKEGDTHISSFTKEEIEIKSGIIKSTEETNIDDTKTLLCLSQRKELKSPEPNTSAAQIKQENTPTLKIDTKDSTFSQECSLSQPSTPSEEKSITFSRTYSSSESENFSERSSFSSATSSTSSSGRSYQSGDKLKVYIKRIALPQSPSTSSQTSTSEEQNSPDFSFNINKKKPPTAKRSKRLQNKSLELFDNQDSTENTDDCFQKISTDEGPEIKNEYFNIIKNLQEQQNVDEETEKVLGKEEFCSEISSGKSIENKKYVKTPQTRNKQVNIIQESKEQIKVDTEKQQIEDVKEESTKILPEPQDEKDMTDSIKTQTPKCKNTEDVSTMVKRKSLRIRKGDSEEKDQETIHNMQEATKEIKEKNARQSQEKQIKQEKVKNKEELAEPKQQAKRTLKEQEETLSETKQQEEKKYKDKPDQQADQENKKESEKEKFEEEITQTKQQKKTNITEQGDTITEQKLQQEQEEKTEKQIKVMSQEKDIDDKEKEFKVLTTNKTIRGKRSPKSLTLTSESFKTTNEIKEKGTAESTTKLDIPSTDLAPRKNKFINETTSSEKLFDNDSSNKPANVTTADTSIKSKTGKTSPVGTGDSSTNLDKLKIDIKESEPSTFTLTRSKTTKTSPVQAIESPKTSANFRKESVTSHVDAPETECSNTYSTETLSDINPGNKSSIDIKETDSTKFSPTGKTSPVDDGDSPKNSDFTEIETLKSQSENSKQKIFSFQSPKTSTEETVGPSDIDTFKTESSKVSGKITKKSMLTEEKKPIIDITEKESLKMYSKKKSSEELSSIEIQETFSLPLEDIIKPLNDVNEQESPKSLSKKSKAENNSSPLPTKYASDFTELQPSKPTSSTKTQSDIERPSSAKRKSLRNQKDKNSDDSTSSSPMETNEQDKLNISTNDKREESVYSLNTTQEDVDKEKSDTTVKVITEETIKVPKRRGRKSRFKNLHGPETESETESSTGKQTPIDETMMADRKNNPTPPQIEKTDKTVVTKENKCIRETEYNKNNEKESSSCIEDSNVFTPTASISVKKSRKTLEEKDDDEINMNLKEKSLQEQKHDTTNTLLVSEKSEGPLLNPTVHSETYLIKNVSIETNTLLDILRTVQSNTAAAALEANKKFENPTEDKPAATIRLKDTQISRTKCEDLPSVSQDGNFSTLKSLNQLEEASNINSPPRSDTDSPLALKKVAISPTRSDSSSPFTLKKVGQSPTRSETSSPLTLKKVTRRYERRSRRGDDSPHKTLEETFAEIAAQSCKAVLAAKSFDTNDEFVAKELEEDKFKMDTEREQTIEEEKDDKLLEKVKDIDDNSTEVSKKSQETKQSILEVSNTSEHESTTEMSKDTPSVHITLEKFESNILEKELETSESCKVTPARRGRKPKNRVNEVLSPIIKDQIIQKDNDEINLPKIKNDIQKSKDALDMKQLPSSKDLITESPIKTSEETIENKEASKETVKNKDTSITAKALSNINEISNDEDNKQADHYEESSVLTQIQETPSKSPESDSKLSKKTYKKRDKTKESPPTAEDDNTYQEDDIRTPKQTTKKPDSSLTKSETKSIGKKLTKKNKNNEEDSNNPQKEDDTHITSTPPPKRGRKPKNQQDSQQPTSSSKKKNKKEILNESNDDEIMEEKRKELESESDSLNSSLDKSLDEKLAKKKRQKKLKEAFEAALTDDELNKNKETINSNSPSTPFGLTLLNKSPPPPPPERRNSYLSESIRTSCITPEEPEEDPDPLKDIEKFIADGVNLLKKDYKLDEDSVDDVIAATAKTNETEEIPIKTTMEDDKAMFNTFETPADTPITTPSVTPPPISPTSVESTTPDETSGVRRSHRIKLITKTPKALVGRGLVRDRERFSIKDDVETKSHYTLDDHLMDLAEVEAKNAKFLKEMEERLSNFQVIKENEYLCERVISREARKMICDCFLTQEEEERGELGCGEDCLNRLLMIECGPECNVKERCTNKRFQTLLCSPCRVFRTEKKGFGIMADIEILPGEFIMEYVGEVIDTEIFEQRRIMYSQDKNRHYYFMALRSDAIIDATIKGNISRFINHSCDPNAETQKWTVNGELRIGFFSRKSIMPGEEITFNYQYQRYGREAQRCYCESANCRGWIGPEPTSDEGEQIDDDDDDESDDDDELEEEEETQVTATLLEQDDDEDSDASVADPEEVQKKLEMAAAQAEVELAPITILEDTSKKEESTTTENKENDDLIKRETEEEDSKSKFKKLLSIMAEKVAAKQKQNKREQKLQRKKKSKESSSELTNKLRFLEDPDIEDEVEFLRECGLKNQSDTLRLSRLMVRAKLVQTRLNLLDILSKGDLPCRRLFLDYHGLRLVHGWMSEDAGNMQIRLALLQTLDTLPIANKTVLTDSKVMQMVRNWCGSQSTLSPNDDSSSSNSNSQDISLPPNANLEGSDLQELQKLALKLIATWEGLPEIFRIPKKERIEQMKEHEREADRQYAANAEKEENKTFTDRYRRDRFGKGLCSTTMPITATTTTASTSNRFLKPNNGNPLRTSNNTTTATTTTAPKSNKNLSKAQRREMFAAKVARDEAEKRMAEERREFETKCRFFGLEPKKTRPQDIPFCVNPATGQWYSIERKPITTPPSYAHVHVPLKPKSTDPSDYQLPAVCSNLPNQWKYTITPEGKIYYYHIKYRIPQWEPPTLAQLQQCEVEAEEEADSEIELAATAGEDSSEDDDEILIGMDAVQLRAYIDRKVETRRQKRYQRLVDQRPISPRREEDRIYNQIEVRKYKENKEKIRKRKEEIRRKRAEALRQSSLNMCTLGSINETNLNANKIQTESDEELGVLPIQDYLLSSDEEIDLKSVVNSPLIDKIVEGDKIVDELDALTSKRQLKRPLPPHRDLSEPSTSSSASNITTSIDRTEHKKRKLEKKEKRKPKDQDAKYRKNKEKFRCEIAGIIVHYLKPYRRDTCTIGRIQSNEDFNHLARKLTHFVMIKELKYCESVGQTLVVTESVKNKSREFIKKYMAKYSDVYIKPSNDPDFKDIPFTL